MAALQKPCSWGLLRWRESDRKEESLTAVHPSTGRKITSPLPRLLLAWKLKSNTDGSRAAIDFSLQSLLNVIYGAGWESPSYYMYICGHEGLQLFVPSVLQELWNTVMWLTSIMSICVLILMFFITLRPSLLLLSSEVLLHPAHLSLTEPQLSFAPSSIFTDFSHFCHSPMSRSCRCSRQWIFPGSFNVQVDFDALLVDGGFQQFM